MLGRVVRIKETGSLGQIVVDDGGSYLPYKVSFGPTVPADWFREEALEFVEDGQHTAPLVDPAAAELETKKFLEANPVQPIQSAKPVQSIAQPVQSQVKPVRSLVKPMQTVVQKSLVKPMQTVVQKAEVQPEQPIRQVMQSAQPLRPTRPVVQQVAQPLVTQVVQPLQTSVQRVQRLQPVQMARPVA